jgi:peptide/nickel transport system substrate-binding protein
MPPFAHLTKTLTLGACAATLLATSACGGSSSAQSSDELVSDATFRLAITADPGSLNPLGSNLAAVQQIAAFLYDPLVHEEGGKVIAGLATTWKTSGTTSTFGLREGVTCADGSPLTAKDVAATINYVADPKNASPLAGMTVPSGSTAKASADGTEITLTTPEPSGFLLSGLSELPIVCGSGLRDLHQLTDKSSGTGPYTLVSAKPGSTYELKRRADYAWGPDGSTSKTPGLPARVTITVMSNETTAANLLLGGDLDAATVAGSDRSRLKAAGLKAGAAEFVYGEFEYNQRSGRPTADPAVRLALTQALDLEELRKVATSGTGTQPTRLTGVSPCGDGDVADSLPKRDVTAAKAHLESLSGTQLTLAYLSKLGPAAAAAADLAVEQWKAVGVNVVARGMSDAQLLKVAYETGNFDIAWIPIDGQNPAQVVASFSGPSPANGGGNFAAIANDTYAQLTAKAMGQSGDEACATWKEAEASLASGADVVPFANSDYPIWAGKQASFDVDYVGVIPMSVRMHQ